MTNPHVQNTGETICYHGKAVTITSFRTEGTVTVVGFDGKEFSIPISELKMTSLFDMNKKAEQERKEKIAYYQDKAEEAKEQKLAWKEKAKEAWHKLWNTDKNDPLYAVIKDEMWNAKFKTTPLGNIEGGNLLDAFMTACG